MNLQAVFILAVLFIAQNAVAADVCEPKFLAAGIKPGTKDCETSCATLPFGMGDFNCSMACEDFCKTYVSPDMIEKYVPQKGLMPSEHSLIAKYPKEALIIFKAKLFAEAATDRLFGRSRNNDESDAFRHFVWAGLSAREAGLEKAKLFLEAHETNPGQAKNEKTMDLANNNSGMKAASLLKDDPNFQEKLEKEALKLLKDKELSVLQPRNEVPPWLGY
jgi:hypothetical protein